jgi:hypothetical protein
MAANTTLNPGASGDVIRDVDRSGVKTQVVLLDLQDGAGGESIVNGAVPTTVKDPAQTTGSLTVVDSVSTSATNAQNQPIVTGTPTASSSASATATGQETFTVQVSGTFSATIAFERSFDGGTSWIAWPLEVIGQAVATITSLVASDNKVYLFRGRAGGATNVRVRCTAFTSGTVSLKFQSSYAPSDDARETGGNLTSMAAVEGAITGAAAITDVNGTMQQYLRGLVKLAITAGGFLMGVSKINGSTIIEGGIAGSQGTGGNVAHGSSNTGANPDYAGGEAIAHGTNPTAVTAAQRTKAYLSRAGIPFVMGGHPNVGNYGMSFTTALTNAIIGPTIGSGLILVITRLTVTMDNANTVFPSMVIGFGASTTPAFATTPGTTKVLAGHPGVPAGGGFSIGDGSGIIGIGGDGEELRCTTVGTVTNGYITISYYTIES